MAGSGRPSTPPQASSKVAMDITPEQIRRMEENRLRAKALRSQPPLSKPNLTAQTSSPASTGQKRSHSAISQVPATARDARQPNSNNGLAAAQDGDIRAARKFQKFVEYDFSKMTDTKGGFMTQEDDPHNKTLHAPAPDDGKPANMTLKDWERQQLARKLRTARAGPYEPGLSVLAKPSQVKTCAECGTREIDWAWEEVLHCAVCNSCKERLPEKYSLLTKTEAREDYLLTEPELKDEQLLPHLEKPNPHKSNWHPMYLYLRCQVEEYAFSAKKWGSPEALDQEFEKRQMDAKARKEKKFKDRLAELKKRTRVDAYKKARAGGGGTFGDTIGDGRHEHEWGRSVEDPQTGVTKKACVECGMEVEEMEF
nr:dna repair protein rad14 [Quercus suber]